ncbi:hypothetical protein E1301_Tti017465 [Triplophysa tibetana]|uniref:Uncharacterized protein n=1 Tax=Triplophysa tibetana TaxID=1572043 RepID=A0A5A9NWL3_9TELE|nr:hypothetical protein E1301_Tti017465 [Triplophysa tibetana]
MTAFQFPCLSSDDHELESVIATVSQQVDVALPNQSPGLTGHSSASVSRSDRSEFEQRCAAVRSSIHSRRQRRGGRVRRGGGADAPPPPSSDDQWQTSTDNRKDIIPEHETDLSAREGFPPPHLLQNREC